MANGTENPKPDFIKVPLWILGRTDVSMGAKLTYGRLLLYAGENGECFPRQETIADALGVTRRMVRKYISELVGFKLHRIGQARTTSEQFILHDGSPAPQFR